MAKNPVIQKAFEDGKKMGYRMGLEHGELRGIEKASDFFAQKFEALQGMSGVGPKTMDKFREAFGHEYFKEIE